MISCKEVARLLDTEQMKDQGLMKRLQVRMHLWMCRHCKRFARQIRQLRAAARQMLGSAQAAQPDGEFEERILRRLSTK